MYQTEEKRYIARRPAARNPEAKRASETHRHRWDDNVTMNLKKLIEEIEWIHLAQNNIHLSALINKAIHICMPQRSGNFYNCLATIGF
jgi:hypothetical protein